MDERARRIGENELLYQTVNEQIRVLDRRFGGQTPPTYSFLCECGNAECAARIDLSITEYERTHEDATRFIVLPGHEKPTVETVIEQYDSYAVIQKHDGGPAEFGERHRRN